jgi:hypothetical protein
VTAMSEMGKMLSLNRLARRKFVIAYWIAILLFIGALTEASWRQGPDFVDRSLIWFWWTLILFPLILRSIVTNSTRGSELQSLMKPAESGPGLVPRRMDERELSLHYRMYAKSYYLLKILIPAGAILIMLLETHGRASLSFTRVPLLWLLALVVTSLPDTMILWNAPAPEL